MPALTDEERKKLTTILRVARPGHPPGELYVLAADEIERLEKENRQSAERCEELREDVQRLVKEVKEIQRLNKS